MRTPALVRKLQTMRWHSSQVHMQTWHGMPELSALFIPCFQRKSFWRNASSNSLWCGIVISWGKIFQWTFLLLFLPTNCESNRQKWLFTCSTQHEEFVFSNQRPIELVFLEEILHSCVTSFFVLSQKNHCDQPPPSEFNNRQFLPRTT